MKSLKNIILASSILILSAFTISSYLNWNISEGYEIKFSSSTGDPEGIFKTINGDIQLPVIILYLLMLLPTRHNIFDRDN